MPKIICLPAVIGVVNILTSAPFCCHFHWKNLQTTKHFSKEQHPKLATPQPREAQIYLSQRSLQLAFGNQTFVQLVRYDRKTGSGGLFFQLASFTLLRSNLRVNWQTQTGQPVQIIYIGPLFNCAQSFSVCAERRIKRRARASWIPLSLRVRSGLWPLGNCWPWRQSTCGPQWWKLSYFLRRHLCAWELLVRQHLRWLLPSAMNWEGMWKGHVWWHVQKMKGTMNLKGRNLVWARWISLPFGIPTSFEVPRKKRALAGHWPFRSSE